MSGFCYGVSLPLKVDETKKKVYENDEFSIANYPFREPKVFLQGYGEDCIPQTCSSWSSDGVVLVRESAVIEYTQMDFTEGLMRDKDGNVVWRSMGPVFTDECADGEFLDKYRSAQRYLITEYDLKTLTTKKYRVVLDESSKFNKLDFLRLGEFLEGKILDDHYVVNNGVLKQCIGEPDDLVIPDSVSEIDESLLCGHRHFKTILIPEKLVDIPDTFFKNCSAECVAVADGNPKYYVENDCLIDRYTSTLVWAYAGTTIPDNGSIKRIGANAFGRAPVIKSIVIPDSVTEIESGAFKGCYWLEEISMSDRFADRVEDIFGKEFVKEGDIWKIVKVEISGRTFNRFSF